MNEIVRLPPASLLTVVQRKKSDEERKTDCWSDEGDAFVGLNLVVCGKNMEEGYHFNSRPK